MFSHHTIKTSPSWNLKNAMMLFLTVILGLGSISVRATVDTISINTDITNAVQYIKKIVVTNNGTESGITGLVIDGTATAGQGIKVSGLVSSSSTALSNANVLAVDANGVLWLTGINTLGGGLDINAVNTAIGNYLNTYNFPSFWTQNTTYNSIYNNNSQPNVSIGGTGAIVGGRLVIQSDSTNITHTLYLNEKNASGSDIYFKDGGNTGRNIVGKDTFIIGAYTGANPIVSVVRIYPNGNITSLGTISVGTGGAPGGIYFARSNDAQIHAGIFSTGTSTTNELDIVQSGGNASRIILNQAGIDMRTSTANASRIYIQSGTNGYVGINTSSPTKQLEVNGDIRVKSGASIGATGTQQIYFSGVGLGYVGINDNTPSEALDIGGNLMVEGNGTPAYIKFNALDSRIGNNANQIFIGSNGNVGINTGSSSIAALTVSGNILMFSGSRIGGTKTGNKIFFVSSGSTGFIGIGSPNPQYTLDVSGSALANNWYIRSDRRLKTDLTVMSDALDKILSLNGYYFTWKGNGIKSFGVIAQEVEKIFPQIVSTSADGTMVVAYQNLVAPLIEAVKALNTKITQLFNLYFDQQQQINQLEQRIQTLETKK